MHITKTHWIVGLLLLLLLAAGCHNFYKANTVPGGYTAAGTIDSLQAKNRYFILRSGGQAYYMSNLALSSDRKTLTAKLDSLPIDHKLHLVNGRGGNLRYSKHKLTDTGVLTEVHLYAPAERLMFGDNYSLPLDNVQKIEVLEKDAKRTTDSYVIGAIGYTLGAAAVALIIVAATKSSCPFVSAYDGRQFALQGEIYGGALYPQLARHDYLPLKMAPLPNGTLQLKITNELKEKQYTDLADLLVVTHNAGTRVAADEQGRLYSLAAPQVPVAASLGNGKDLLYAVAKEADDAVAYLDDTSTADARNNVVLRFKKEGAAAKARLVLTLKNAYWLDLLYGDLAKGFGSYYETYLKKQAKKPAADLVRWTKEQQIPLAVSVRTKSGWQHLTDLTTVGPLAFRTVAVPVDLANTTEEIQIRLSSGFLFWEIDYAALDFSAGDAYDVQRLTPVTATDETGKDVLPLLQKEDGSYLEQPYIGNSTTVAYKAPPLADAAKTQSFFLHAKGWYRHVRNFSNGPNAAFLKRFLTPNAFPVYGKQRYKEFQTESLRFMASR